MGAKLSVISRYKAATTQQLEDEWNCPRPIGALHLTARNSAHEKFEQILLGERARKDGLLYARCSLQQRYSYYNELESTNYGVFTLDSPVLDLALAICESWMREVDAFKYLSRSVRSWQSLLLFFQGQHPHHSKQPSWTLRSFAPDL